jgi:hypothetical protein
VAALGAAATMLALLGLAVDDGARIQGDYLNVNDHIAQ